MHLINYIVPLGIGHIMSPCLGITTGTVMSYQRLTSHQPLIQHHQLRSVLAWPATNPPGFYPPRSVTTWHQAGVNQLVTSPYKGNWKPMVLLGYADYLAIRHLISDRSMGAPLQS